MSACLPPPMAKQTAAPGINLFPMNVNHVFVVPILAIHREDFTGIPLQLFSILPAHT